METKDYEKVVLQQAAAAFVNGMPEETRTTLTNQATETAPAKTIPAYGAEQEAGERTKADTPDYTDAYAADPEAQARLKESAHEAAERLSNSATISTSNDLRDNMKSKYCKFAGKE